MVRFLDQATWTSSPREQTWTGMVAVQRDWFSVAMVRQIAAKGNKPSLMLDRTI